MTRNASIGTNKFKTENDLLDFCQKLDPRIKFNATVTLTGKKPSRLRFYSKKNGINSEMVMEDVDVDGLSDEEYAALRHWAIALLAMCARQAGSDIEGVHVDDDLVNL